MLGMDGQQPTSNMTVNVYQQVNPSTKGPPPAQAAETPAFCSGCPADAVAAEPRAKGRQHDIS